MSFAPAFNPQPAQAPIGEALWDAHFIDPIATIGRVRELLAAPATHENRTLAWSELIEGYHRLFFSLDVENARFWLDRAGARFLALGDRRGALLVDVGHAKAHIADRQCAAARELLRSMHVHARRELPTTDYFWFVETICATHLAEQEIDEAIRHMVEGLDVLRSTGVSPQLVTMMVNLASALLFVADYVPARELASEAVELSTGFDNPRLALSARTCLADAQLHTGDRVGAMMTVDAMFAELNPATMLPQNHYCSIAAEVYALEGRLDQARAMAVRAQAIHDALPSGHNEVHWLWAQACVARALDSDDVAVRSLEAAVAAADKHEHLPTLCKAGEALADRLIATRRFEDACHAQRRLFSANNRRFEKRTNARYYLLRIEHELSNVRAERDSAVAKRREFEELNRQLGDLNAELSRKMREVEELQARLAREAVHDPLTQLFNRRYLDSAMPGLVGSAERWATPLTLALIDLDHFKRVNDRHGHLAGDKVLRHIGRLFSTSLRPSDIVCRWGGEEFCIVFPDTDIAGASTALGSLAAKLATLNVSWGPESIGGLTFSAALAVHGVHGRTLDELVASADCALYAAKDEGRDRVLVARA
ncbi:MAG TPA: diguanylate cyclase [Casimicrobiaceae bacterium]|nr:diguanylate cyclase [Casimicrobiaceae bacterium]